MDKEIQLFVFYKDASGNMQMRLTAAAKAMSEEQILDAIQDAQSLLGTAVLRFSYPDSL